MLLRARDAYIAIKAFRRDCPNLSLAFPLRMETHMSTPLFSHPWGLASLRRLLAVLAIFAMGTFAATSVSAQDIGNTLQSNLEPRAV